ncbi:MAG: peroxidase family protein, partial [Pseudomonadota bacterium]
DGSASLTGAARLGAREISNRVADQISDRPNALGASAFVWQWGQFLDHDIDLTDGTNPPEPANIPVPPGDLFFDPLNTGTAIIPFNRSIYLESAHTGGVRQQINEITAWIDGSNVYGSDLARANALRLLDGSGKLKTSANNLLPFNVDGHANAGGTSNQLFLAGDVRANEQVGLTALHTLFVREHNRIATDFAARNPGASGDEIYEHTRRMVGALLQKITYYDYLPLLLGSESLPDYSGYDRTRDARIRNVFSTAIYRFGHSALNEQLLRVDNAGEMFTGGHLSLREAFFAPQHLQEPGSLDALLRGFALQRQQAIDVFIIDDVRNFLFGEPGRGGFDLVALNIQRGRDHGLPDYNSVRVAYGLPPVASVPEISSDTLVSARLQEAYPDITDVDVWVGALAEDHVPGALVGELMLTVMREQFLALREGDRFWFERTFRRREIDQIKNTTLADIIQRNSAIGDELAADVFRVPTHQLANQSTIASRSVASGSASLDTGTLVLVLIGWVLLRSRLGTRNYASARGRRIAG